MPQLTGTYQAVVSATTDPARRGRVRLQVPQVSGAAIQGWARPAFDGTRVPAVGEEVWVFYEGGDPARPVYMSSPVAADSGDYDPIEPLVSVQSGFLTYQGVQTTYYLAPENDWPPVSLRVPPSGALFASMSATVFPGKRADSQVSAAWAVYDEDVQAYVFPSGRESELHRRGTRVGAAVPGVGGTMMTRRFGAFGLTPGNRIQVRPMYMFLNNEASEFARIAHGRLTVEPVPLSPYPPTATQQLRQPKFLNSASAPFSEDDLAEIQTVVPPSGKMFVSISGLLSPASTTVGDDLFYTWTAQGSSGWSDNLPRQTKQFASTANAVCAGTRRTLLTGLTPGDVVRVQPAYGTGGALTSSAFTAMNGQLLVEPVLDTPELPVQESTQRSTPILLGGSAWVDFTEQQWAPLTTTVPPTGCLFVSISASLASNESDTSELRIGWKVTGDYAWSGDGIAQALMTKGKTWTASGTKRHLLDGLTPGSTVTITPQYWCSANSTTSGGSQTNTVAGGQLTVEPVRAGNAARLSQQLATQENETAHFRVVASSRLRGSLRPVDGDAYVMADTETIEAKVNGKWLTVAEKRPYIMVHKDSQTVNSTSNYFPWTTVITQNESGLYSQQDPDAVYTTKEGIYEISVNCRWASGTTGNRMWVNTGGKEFRLWSLEEATSGAHGVSGSARAALKAGSMIRIAARAATAGTITDVRMSVEYKGPVTSGKYDNV